MNRDILSEYLSRKDSIEPRADFKEELIASLSRRILRLERRRYIISTMLSVSFMVLVIAAIAYYLPLESIKFDIDFKINPLYLIAVTTLSTMVFIGTYIINMRNINDIKRQIEAMK